MVPFVSKSVFLLLPGVVAVTWNSAIRILRLCNMILPVPLRYCRVLTRTVCKRNIHCAVAIFLVLLTTLALHQWSAVQTSAFWAQGEPNRNHGVDLALRILSPNTNETGVISASNRNGSPTENTSTHADQGVPWCSVNTTFLRGEEKVHLDLNYTDQHTIVQELGHVMEDGGHYVPFGCRSREKLAIIIPYRDRKKNLHILLRNLLPFLWRQKVEFTIFVAEQTDTLPFNKGVLFNAAYVESQKPGLWNNFTCWIMQDTDLLPVDNRNLYRCDVHPRHLVLAVGQTSWPKKPEYRNQFGGAIAVKREHMEKSNGFSNLFYGWGLEDDDLSYRMRKSGYKLKEYGINIGRYYRLNHTINNANPSWELLRKSIGVRHRLEGLNSLNYTVKTTKEKLFTWLLIEPPPPPPILFEFNSTIFRKDKSLLNQQIRKLAQVLRKHKS